MSIIKSHDITLYGSAGEYDIILRPLCDDHLPLLYIWGADPEVVYWSDSGNVDVFIDEEVRDIIGSVSQNALCFLVEVNGVNIGNFWLQNMNIPEVSALYPGLDVRRIDAEIGEKEYWGKGIGTEIIRMLIEYAFYGENVDVLYNFTADYNLRSQKILLNFGFEPCGEDAVEDSLRAKKEFHYRITRECYSKLNPDSQFLKISTLIKRDLKDISHCSIQQLRLIRAKSGVHVYRCLYDGKHAVIKYFENEDDRREILNYRILSSCGIPIIKTLALGKESLVMEDIVFSNVWRLGVLEDLGDTDVAESLAKWYFTFHENGTAVKELDNLYFEFALITKENLKILANKLPEANELFQFVITNYSKFFELIYKPSFTLTYNDFYWVNFVVRNDKKAAMMFDYNLLGKGYRYSDFRNVCWSLSDDAKSAFMNEYNRLFFEKHGCNRTEEEKLEKSIDDLSGLLHSLVVAFIERDSFPDWAEHAKTEAINGSLLLKAKQLL